MTTLITQEEIFRYSRHLMIPGVGLEGQKKLKSASVLIVGAGGLGSPVSLYLAAAGVGHIGLVDDDVVDSSNLQRQILHDSPHVGELKAESGRERLSSLNPYIQVDAICDFFNAKTATNIASGFDILVDCSDNFATRYLINDLCVLTRRPDVYGAIYQFEGQVGVFDSTQAGCYRCVFPEPPPPELATSCSLSGVFGVLPGVIGSLQAVEVIKLIVGIGQPLYGQLMIYDALESSFQTIKLRKQPTCRVCGSEPSITNLIESEHFCGDKEIAPLNSSELITALELSERLKESEPPMLIDIRPPIEYQVSMIEGAILIPLEKLNDQLKDLDKNREYVVFCRTGIRSVRALKLMKKSDFKKVRNLVGGINAWAQHVKKGLFQY
jgi:adenylyltransferase/sulfurtransferase